MAWTNDQLKAIKTRGGKVLVSAAAGSGKTAVLSERVLDFVLSGGNIDKLLVVTFTDAAAIEMKIRIKQKIEEQSLKEPDNHHLIKQLTLIDNAKIATMDSFYSELVKQNFDKLGIMPNFSILSSAEEDILKNKVVSKVLEDSFKKEGYINLLHTLCANDNNLIKDKVLKIESFLSTIPFYEDYIDDLLNKYDSSYYKDLFIEDIKKTFSSFKKLYYDIKQDLYNSSSDFDKLNDNILEEENIINKMLNVNNFDELSDTIRLSSFSKQAVIRGHSQDYIFNKYKKIRANLKEEILKKLDYLVNINEEEYQRQMNLLKNTLTSLFDIVIEYKKELLKEKKKMNKYSFSDIPLFVIDLLIKDKKKTSLALEISKNFDEILIDEYQDTNKLQSIIFNSISKDESNLFVVGDIKQSIYRFRSACPEIFNDDKNKSFKESFPMLITLSKNFRSRNLVLDFCNYIFECTMTDYLGEVDYNQDEKLYTGASFPENMEAVSEVDVITFESEKDEEDELTSSQKEAIYVADKIKSLLDSKYQVYDKKGFYRDIKPSDIAILSRSLSNSDLYINALSNRKIGVYCNKDLVFFDNYDVKLIISLLKIIDNVYDDISLMTVLKSNLFNISDNDIASVRINNRYGYLYDAIIKSEHKKLLNIIETINDIKEYSLNHTLEDTINYMYKKLDIINLIGTDKKKIKNLTLMVKNTKDFNESTSFNLHEFVSYIEEILLDKSSFSGANPLSDGDNVLMTTIHRSKGLEYPVVFVCNTGKKFNDSDFKSDYIIDSNYGISFDLFDYDKKYKYEAISTKVLKKKMKLLMLSEELRVLYVALTRAREKLIITGCVNNLTKLLQDASYLIGDDNKVDTLYLENCNNYIRWILSSLLKHKSAKVLREYADVDVKTFNYDTLFKVNIVDANTIKDEVLENEVSESINEEELKINSYDYTFTNVPKKLSVSEIKLLDNKYTRKPYFLNSDVKNTNLGTLYHKIFELLSVKRYTLSSLKEELDKLSISENERKLIDLNKIFSYLTSDLYDIILNSHEVYKEKQIMFYVPSSYYDKNLNNGEILVDGTIDLLVVKDDIYYIIDYKTDNVDDIRKLKDMYKLQLDLYEIGVKNIMNAKQVKKIIYSIRLNKYIEV